MQRCMLNTNGYEAHANACTVKTNIENIIPSPRHHTTSALECLIWSNHNFYEIPLLTPNISEASLTVIRMKVEWEEKWSWYKWGHEVWWEGFQLQLSTSMSPSYTGRPFSMRASNGMDWLLVYARIFFSTWPNFNFSWKTMCVVSLQTGK